MSKIRPKVRERRDGTFAYIVQLPADVKKSTGLSTSTFNTETDALAFAEEVERRKTSVYKQSFSTVSAETVDDLFKWYITTQEFRTIKENSKTSYLGQMKKSSESRHLPDGSKFGDMAITNVTRKSARLFINHFAATEDGNSAYTLCKILRLIWNVALQDEDDTCGVELNPWQNQRVAKPKPRKAAWTDRQLLDFVKHADNTFNYTLGSMALFCFRLCQRPGDIRQLKWDNINDNHLRVDTEGLINLDFTQEKTGAECWFELPRELRERIKWHREVHEIAKRIRPPSVTNFIFLSDKFLQPYDRYYYHDARKVMDEVGLPQSIRFGDFRRSGISYIADRDATEDQMMAVTGHMTREGLSPYLHRSKKRANQIINKVYGD